MLSSKRPPLRRMHESGAEREHECEFMAYECMRLFTLFGFNELQIVSFDVNHLPYTQLFSTLPLCEWEKSVLVDYNWATI